MNEKVFFEHLKSIKASENLRKRISGLTYALPVERKQFMPGFAFAAIVMSVIFMIVGLGSGIMIASQNSKPGSPLYPVKQAIGKVQGPLNASIEKKENPPTPIPTASVSTDSAKTPTLKPTQTENKSFNREDIQKSFKQVEDSVKHFFRRDSVVENHRNSEHKNQENNSRLHQNRF